MTNPTINFRGIYTIPPTPFDAAGAVDETSLRRTVDFCIAAGAHGIVYPVNASEFTTLTDDERRRVVTIVVEQTAGRTPVVAGVTGTSQQHMVALARHATDVGADALIAMPPYVRKATPSDDEIVAAYRALAAVGDLPVVVQDFIGPVGTPMAARLLSRIFTEVESVVYLKEETTPAGPKMSQVLAQAGDRIGGIMGGAAGRFLLDEVRRGACGTMPACEITDLHVRLWELLENKRFNEARDYFDQILPLLNFEALYSVAVYKEVLRRRGVIETATLRLPGAVPLDDYAHQELDAILARLEPLFRV